MTIDACIAHAIHSDMDILQVLPNINEMRVEEIEPTVESFVTRTMDIMSKVIRQSGQLHLEKGDAAGLCVLLLESDLKIPCEVLLKMCRKIIELYPVEVWFWGLLKTGDAVFSMRLVVDLSSTLAA